MPDPALDHAGRLGQFLDRTIAELKPRERQMNKFEELAQRVARTQRALDERADKLAARLDSFDAKADATFSKHEGAMDAAEGGIDKLEESLSGMIGHNGAPNESKT